MENFSEKIYDKEFRQKLVENPKKVLQDLGYEGNVENIEFVILKNTKDTIYMALDSRGESLNIEDIQAAGYASSASSAGSLGTVCTTVSTASSAGTVGSIV